MPDSLTEYDTVVVDRVLVRLLRLEVFQSPGVGLLEDPEPGRVHLEAGQPVHDLVQENPLFITVSLHCEGDPALGVGEAVTQPSQLSSVGIPGDNIRVNLYTKLNLLVQLILE